MISKSPENLRTLALLKLTRSLIMATNPEPFLKEKRLQPKKIEKVTLTRIPAQQQKQRLPQSAIPQNTIKNKHTFTKPISNNQIKTPMQSLKIPEPKLPPQFSYLKPTINKKESLKLGKIDPLLKDPNVGIIEIHGPDSRVIVKGKMGKMPTDITMTTQEMNQVMSEFSTKSRIPINEGLTKIALGHLIFSSITSPNSDPKIVIKKIPSETPRPVTRRIQ